MKKLITLLFVAGLSMFMGCKKQEGCSDTHAYNYDSEAQIEDGTCRYNIELEIWMNPSTADSLKGEGYNKLWFNFGNNPGVVLDSLEWPVSAVAYENSLVMIWRIPKPSVLSNTFVSVHSMEDGEISEESLFWTGFPVENGANYQTELMYQ